MEGEILNIEARLLTVENSLSNLKLMSKEQLKTDDFSKRMNHYEVKQAILEKRLKDQLEKKLGELRIWSTSSIDSYIETMNELLERVTHCKVNAKTLETQLEEKWKKKLQELKTKMN